MLQFMSSDGATTVSYCERSIYGEQPIRKKWKEAEIVS